MIELFHGDCVEVMRSFPENSVDAIVTDPPAGIGFMNRKWDSDLGGRDFWVEWFTGVSKEMLRVMKPGCWAFVWAIPRTSHWTAYGLENGGFEVRDINHHLFGTGKPATTDQAKIPPAWKGWNTALKTAAEHWILVRKPPEGTLADNLEKWNAGALNIDGCRQETEDNLNGGAYAAESNRSGLPGDDRTGASAGRYQSGARAHGEYTQPTGRWPAHVTLDESAVEELDAQAGDIGAPVRGDEPSAAADTVYGPRARVPGAFYNDKGGPSRWWYVAKPSRSEKEAGCEFLPEMSAGEVTGGRKEGSAGLKNSRAGAGRTSGAKNFHPTVKSIALMRRLVRLVTPPAGIVLDPFCGSGTTGIAAHREGVHFVGIEKDLKHLCIANARITYHQGVTE